MSAQRLKAHIETRTARTRTRCAIGGGFQNHQLRLEFVQCRRIDAQSGGRARPEIARDDVRGHAKLLRDFDALGRFHIDRNGTLAAVDRAVRAWNGAVRIAGHRFDLDDLGAQIRQQRRCIGSSHKRAKIDNPHASERRIRHGPIRRYGDGLSRRQRLHIHRMRHMAQAIGLANKDRIVHDLRVIPAAAGLQYRFCRQTLRPDRLDQLSAVEFRDVRG